MVVFSNKQCLQPSTCWCLRSLSSRSALWKDCSTTLSFPWRVCINTLQEAIILPLSKSWVLMHHELTSLVFQLFKGLVDLRFSRTKGRAFGHSSGKNPSWVFIMPPAHSKMLENWGWRGNIEMLHNWLNVANGLHYLSSEMGPLLAMKFQGYSPGGNNLF